MEQEYQNQMNEIQEFHTRLFKGSEESKSIKDEIEILWSSLKIDQNKEREKLEKIRTFYIEIFEDSEEQSSLKSRIEGYHKEFIDNCESSKSARKEIDGVLKDIKKEFENFASQSSEISGYHKSLLIENEQGESIAKSIDVFYSKLFVGNEKDKSINSQFEDLLKSMEERFSMSNDKIKQLEDFYANVFDDQVNDEGKLLKPSLIGSINSQKQRLDKLIKEATEKLYALTDSSLHSAFAKRAVQYTMEFERLEKLTHKLTWAIIIDIVVFGIIQCCLIFFDKEFNYHILIYQFSIAGALVFAIWMFNRNQKIAKKLAEEYHHKTAIAEAMTGYRHLYELDHEDKEYMELFNSLKEQLNVNPSKSIDKFLNLKSPQEEVVESLKIAFSTEKLKEFAEILKPYILQK
jgi:hypothetical protein